jgi:hypothetical protein
MRARLAIVLLLIAIGLVLAVVFLVPVERPALQPTRPTPPKTATQSPTEVVVAYLEALARRDYRAAYDRLSRASQQKHPYDEFASLCETKGITAYDLRTAREERGEDGSVTVAVQLKEDVATAGFRMVKEEERWRVVFIGGIPSYPYP